MTELELDVVIVTFNSADHLDSALTALPPRASVVVVDNRSTDRSIEVARARGVEVIASDVNAGFGASANRGARLGTADFVLFLNPDATITEHDLRRLLQEFESDRDVAVVSPALRTPGGTAQRATWPYPSAAASWREALGLARGRDVDEFVIGAVFMVRRSVFEALDGFDERFWLYAEETDFCRRVLDAGWKVRLIDEAVGIHVGGASGGSEPGLVFDHFNRGMEHFIAKRYGIGGLASSRLALTVGSALRAVAPGSTARQKLHRDRLRRLVRVAATTPFSVPLESPATAAPGKGLVVCSLEPWDDVWRRNQFFVRELLGLDPNRRVLFVEPPFDWVHERRNPTGRRRARGLRPLDADGRIVRVEPGKVWPRVAGPLADRSLRRQVRRATKALGFVDPSLWVNDPAYAGLPAETGWPAVYDITDDWTEAAGSGRSARRVIANEATLFAECEAVVVCSEGLAESRRRLRADLSVIPNAVDVAHFQTPKPRPDDLPPEPTAVYVGTLQEERLDVDLVEALADADPAVNVVLIGPNALPAHVTERLTARSNISVLGARPYATIPSYLQHAAIVIVPHVVSPFTESLDPIKAYECLAVGRPTVVTPVAGFRDLGEPIVVVDRSAFVATAIGELARRTPSQPRTVPTWTDRGSTFADVLQRAHDRTDSSKLRVVYLDHCARLSGGELALVRTLPALTTVEAHVILGEDGPLVPQLRATGATVEVLALDAAMAATHRDEVALGRLGASRVLAATKDTIALARRLREIRPDLVHTNSLKAALYGGVAGRVAGVPVVWHIRDRIAPDYLPRPVVTAVRVLARVLPAAVITNSHATMATLGTFRRSSVVPSPVIGAAGRAHHPRTDTSNGVFRVAMLGRLAEWKGQHIFLDALAQAFGDRPFQAVIAGSAMFGEDAYADRIVAQIESLGLTGRVEMVGFVDDIGALLSGVDCLVHASTIAEPFGQVIVEGMASGLPVIASAAGGPLEIVTDRVDGILTPPGDVGALAAAFRELADDPTLRAGLGEAALRRSFDFSPERVAEQVISVYRSVVADR